MCTYLPPPPLFLQLHATVINWLRCNSTKLKIFRYSTLPLPQEIINLFFTEKKKFTWRSWYGWPQDSQSLTKEMAPRHFAEYCKFALPVHRVCWVLDSSKPKVFSHVCAYSSSSAFKREEYGPMLHTFCPQFSTWTFSFYHNGQQTAKNDLVEILARALFTKS